ncbi:phosphoglycerate dehydrogenase [Neotabrizicola sp. VNH66]|uniref:phosphoglycerate dehydrogenase n=1 Tax=Neotabrizicola sp. VNH66 TaxID=3400918 RepID=UPI003C072AF3
MTGKIAVTPRSLSGAGHPALSLLTKRGYELVFPAPGKTPSEDDLLRAVPGCVGWLAGVEPIGARVLRASEGLRVISRNGVGVDNIDLPVAAAQGVRVERAMGANARGVAELAVTLMLSAFRHVPWSDARLHGGDWQRRLGIEAEGRTLGIVGCGAIGRQVAEIALALGMKVVGYDPFPLAGFAPDGFRYAPLAEVLAVADAVTLHCPPGAEPILNAASLATMKRGVTVINTARAELVEDTAMLAALDSGQVGVLATDVFHAEPPAPSALLAHDRVILTPHAGGFTEESVDRATRTAVENILKVLEG